MTNTPLPASMSAADVKSCCADLYSSDLARLVVGETFHPGGLELTGRLGSLLELDPSKLVLDVASGIGTSAVHLAATFGCRVTGVDLSSGNVERAAAAAEAAGVAHLVSFRQADAEGLPFPDASFDAVICECAFCTFPGKSAATSEMARVLRRGGVVGISDLTRKGELPNELRGALAWISCLGDAGPVEEYRDYLEDAGLSWVGMEDHDRSLLDLVDQIRLRLLGASIALELKRIPGVGADLASAKAMAASAIAEIGAGRVGYSILVAARP